MKGTTSRLWMTILLVVLMATTCLPSFAEVGGYEPEPEINLKSQLNTQIDIKADHSDNYILDDVKVFMSFENPLSSMANAFFDIYKMMVKASIDLTIKAYKFDLYSQLSRFIDTMLLPVKRTVYDGLSGIAIAAGLLVILFVFLSRSTTSGAGQLATFIIILVMSLYFLAYPAKSLSLGRDLMLAISNNLVKNSFQVTYNVKTTDDALASFANKQWEVLVEGPWKTLNFKNSTIRGKYMQQLINTPPGDQRDVIVESMREESPARPAKWLGTVFIMIILIIFTLLPMLAMDGLMIAGSAMVLAVTVLSPIIFCISYLPAFSRSFFSWVTRLFALLALTVVATIGNTFLLNLVDVIFRAMGNQNILSVLSVNALIMVFLFLMRGFLFGIVTSPMQGQRAFDRSTRDRIDLKERGSKDVAGFFGGIKDTKKSAISFVDTSNKIVARGEKGAVDGAKFVYSAPGKAGKWVSEKWKGKFGEEQEPAEETFDYTSAAKNYSNQRYQQEKSEAENKASEMSAKLGMPIQPEYSDYVKGRMEREKTMRRGPSPTEVSETIGRMKQYESVGLKPDAIYGELEGKTPDEIMESGKVETKKRSLNEEVSRKQFRKQAGVEIELTEDMTDRDLAKEYLKMQFKLNLEKSNQDARTKATETGAATEPVYDAFVQQGLDRMKAGKPLNSGTEIDRAENHITEIRKGGVDPREYMKTMDPQDMKTFTGLKEAKKVDIKNVSEGEPGKTTISQQDIKKIAKEAAKEAAKESQKEKDPKKTGKAEGSGGMKWHDHADEMHDKLEKIADQQDLLRDEVNQKMKSKTEERSMNSEKGSPVNDEE